MKRILLVCFAATIMTAVVGCNSSTTVTGPPADTSIITGDTLSGTLKGTLQRGKTYYLGGDVHVNSGDTLVVQPGVQLLDINNHTLYINGSLIATGTKDSMIYMGTIKGREVPGSWGGIYCDSPSVVIMKFCKVWYGCGVRPTGIASPSVYIFSKPNNGTELEMEDCDISYTKDDAFQINGGKGYIVRSTFRMNGIVEGSAINFKAGFIGYAAYNYIWSSNDHAIRCITSTTVLFPQTTVDIYNNTILNYGGKNPTRPGAGVIIDQNARGNVYNNIFVNGRYGLRITKAADTVNTHYGNNLFYTTVDSLQNYFYPPDAVGKPQPTDLIQVDPQLVAFDPNINAATDMNDPHPKPGSPVYGKGNSAYDPDLGAFTSKRP